MQGHAGHGDNHRHEYLICVMATMQVVHEGVGAEGVVGGGGWRIVICVWVMNLNGGKTSLLIYHQKIQHITYI